ncbi:MAG: hypothetical protein BGO68_01955 [Candidatus Amoebophilus sp. 36-38]|nr:MAG: hypothetical protein BGO68_01955 [Candidatus Amoebophilus sp. 36-38]
MKRNYQLNYSLIACIVLSSLFLQSCDSFSTQLTTIIEEPMSGNPETVRIVEREERLSKGEATALGYFEDLPIELVEMIFADVAYPSILACRQLNHFFYELMTGYSQVGLIGVSHKPTAKMAISICGINKCIDFGNLSCTPETIPSFPFYCLMREVKSLPPSFWSYILNTQIHTLDLYCNQVGDSGIQALAKVLPNTQIHTLNLGANQIGASGVQELAKVLSNTHVHTLHLAYNQIGASGVQELAKVLPNSQVHTLYLCGNQIGASGVQELAKVLPGTQVHTFNLRYNQIGDSGVQELAKVLPSTQVHTLDLGVNQISDSGIQELAKVLSSTQVHTLYLWADRIGDEMQRLLKEQHPNITFYF